MLSVARASSVIAVSTALICGVSLPATAAPGDTVLTVVVPAGVLSISAPPTGVFSTLTPGVTSITTATVANVTVTDTRNEGTLKKWIASVELDDFVGTTGATIKAEAVTYLPGLADTSGKLLDGTATVALVTPSATPFILTNDPQTAQSAEVVLGNNSAKWSPLLTLTVPDDAPADTYTATLTHSVI